MPSQRTSRRSYDGPARGTIAPIRRQVVVSANPERAFTAWTEELAVWWPFERHSVFGAGSGAAFVDGQLVETGSDGSQQLWGTVTAWEPGHQLSMTWHPGQNEDAATTVDVRFDAIGDDRTLVTLTHTGWENRVDRGRRAMSTAGAGPRWWDNSRRRWTRRPALRSPAAQLRRGSCCSTPRCAPTEVFRFTAVPRAHRLPLSHERTWLAGSGGQPS